MCFARRTFLRYYGDVYQGRTSRDIKGIRVFRFEVSGTSALQRCILSLLGACAYPDKLETPRVRYRDFFPR